MRRLALVLIACPMLACAFGPLVRNMMLEIASRDDAPDPHLVAWYKLDGDATDSSGNENHGTWNITAAYTNGPRAKTLAAVLDGTSNEPLTFIGYTPINGPEMSVTYWAYITSYSADNFGYVVGRRNIGTYAMFVGGQVESGKMYVQNESAWARTSAQDTGRWVFFAAAIKNQATSLYVDGAYDVDATGGTMSTTLDSTANDIILGGRGYDPDRRFVGYIADVRIYNRALSSNDVNRVMNNQRPKHD